MKFQTPRGTRDFLPEEMIKRQYVLDKIRAVFEKWGFDPLETPAFEEWSLLAAKSGGGEEIKKEIYYFKDKSDRELGLRFDLTVPLGRVVATNSNLVKPFRRYAIDKVWRYDRPGKGRWREFWQADIDIVGSDKPEADATVIAAACDALKSLGFRDFFVRINNRKITENFIKSLGVKNGSSDVFRAIDKLDKIGASGVKEELKQAGVSEQNINKILGFITEKSVKEEGMEELENIVSFLDILGFSKNIKVDFSLVRGLEYYTGPVFEISVGSSLSIGGGGRYDNLVGIFGGKPVPATGISLGIERIIEIMQEKNMISTRKTKTQIFVAAVSDCKSAMKLAEKLVQVGVSVEYDVMGRSLKKQLEYADSRGIPFIAVIGEKEIKEKKFKIKNMKTGEEFSVPMDDLHSVTGIVK